MGILPTDDDHLSAQEIQSMEVEGLVSTSQNETRRVRFAENESSPRYHKHSKGKCRNRRGRIFILVTLIISVCITFAFTSTSQISTDVKTVAKKFLDGFSKNDKGASMLTDDDTDVDDNGTDDEDDELFDDADDVGIDESSDCVDSKATFMIQQIDRNCRFLMDDPKNLKFCSWKKVKASCPKSCGVCGDLISNDDDDTSESSNNTEDGKNDPTEQDGDDDDDGNVTESSNNSSGEQDKAADEDDAILNDIEYYQHEDLSDEDKEEMMEQWGHWHFWDGAAESRPTEDYLSKYQNKDCPFDGFPETAWQADAVYVNHMIDSALELIDRAKEAFYTEYGFGPREDISSEQLSTRMKMFRMSVIPDLDSTSASDKIKLGLERGGWTTTDSYVGISRRMLHAMMTNDDFTVVLAGNSAAAGHGNHFLQSYMAQFDYIMRPIFERLGVNLVTRNLANGDIGTLSNALGSGSIYGDNIDMIIWDSDIENGKDNEVTVDLFYRQALLAGKRPPILMGTQSVMGVLRELHDKFGAEIVVLGSGMASLPQTESEEQAETLPQAVRYLNCTDDMQGLCMKHQYNARCWIERSDFVPLTTQRRTPKEHQSSVNPGFRQHHLKGRVLSFLTLGLLADALSNWGDITIVAGHPLDGEHWHITDHIQNIKAKIQSIDGEYGLCSKMKEFIPERVCGIPIQARTEFTPRFDPSNTGIVNIVNPGPDGFLPSLSEEEKMSYNGPDVPNPSLLLPKEVIDVHAIVSNRRLLMEQQSMKTNIAPKTSFVRRRMNIETGTGWALNTLPGTCDGSTTAICGREPTSDCLLYGHMDHKGGLVGDSSSGWLSMKLSNISHGIIMLKLELISSDTSTTESIPIDSLQNDFIFEYAIDGDVTTLSKDEFFKKKKSPEPKVDIVTLMDNPDFASGEEKTIDIAFQFKNCADCKFKLSHVYWA